MNKNVYVVILFILIAGCLCIAGCVNTSGVQQPASQQPASTQTLPTQSPQVQTTVPIAQTTQQPTSNISGLPISNSKTANQVVVDETYITQYNNFYCTDLQEALGEPYIYPDEKYKIFVSSSTGPNWGHTNILILQDNDELIFTTQPPRWDDIKKTYVYEGIVPVVQFNDVMSERSKIFSVKKIGKFFICLDDRQDTTQEGFVLHTGAPAFEAHVKLIKNP